MSDKNARRATLLTTAVALFEQITTKQMETNILVEVPNQGARALMAQSFSLFNAGSTVLKEAFLALGYRTPDINPFVDVQPAPAETGLVVTESHLGAASSLLELADRAFAAASELYVRYVEATEAGDEFAAPEIDDAFQSDLAARASKFDLLKVTLEVLRDRLTELTARHGDKTAAAAFYASAAAELVKGTGEDLDVARGKSVADQEFFDKQWEKAVEDQKTNPDPMIAEIVESVGIDAAKEFFQEALRMHAQMIDSSSVGTRVGFLRAAVGEGDLAKAALNLLATELAAVEPIPHPGPCLIGRDAIGAPSADNVPEQPLPCLIGRDAIGAPSADNVPEQPLPCLIGRDAIGAPSAEPTPTDDAAGK